MAVVTGLETVIKNLNKEVKKIEGRTREGLHKAAKFVEGESNEMAPHDFGVLIDSSFSQIDPSPKILKATVGYTAKYAAAVHEMPGTLKGQPRADFGKTGNRSKFGPRQVVDFGGGSKKGTYWDNGEPKFLEKAVKNNHKQILGIIAKRAKIK